MESLGRYNDRQVFWLDFIEESFHELPESDWICFGMSNENPFKEPLSINLTKFCGIAIDRGVLEFKTFGKESSMFDDFFDFEVVAKNIERGEDFFVNTTWHDKESLASAFWQCFHATCIPDNADHGNLKVVCVHFENIDKRQELKGFLEKFNKGWLPEE